MESLTAVACSPDTSMTPRARKRIIIPHPMLLAGNLCDVCRTPCRLYIYEFMLDMPISVYALRFFDEYAAFLFETTQLFVLYCLGSSAQFCRLDGCDHGMAVTLGCHTICAITWNPGTSVGAPQHSVAYSDNQCVIMGSVIAQYTQLLDALNPHIPEVSLTTWAGPHWRRSVVLQSRRSRHCETVRSRYLAQRIPAEFPMTQSCEFYFSVLGTGTHAVILKEIHSSYRYRWAMLTSVRVILPWQKE